MEDDRHLSRRCAASLGALSAQYSNLAVANSKLAAQCSASDAPLRDGSGSQGTLMRTCARARAFLARACECGVFLGWTCQRERHVDTPSTMLGTMWRIPHQGGIPCGVPVVLHESTRSTLSDRLQHQREYSEYLL